MKQPNLVTLAELDAILSTPARPALADVCRAINEGALSDADLCELASETDLRGPAATLAGLLEGLRIRHAGDRATLAVLAAVEHYHVPQCMGDGGRV